MHRNPELEAGILRAPDDPVPYLVYSDWLSEQADPLGELIALQCSSGPVDAARLAMLQQAEVRAALSVVPMAEDLRLTWSRGFLASIRLRRTRATTPPLWPMLEELLVARCSPFVRSLDVALGQFGETPTRFADALLASRGAPMLARLVLRGGGQGELPALRAAFPRLAELEIVDGASLELAEDAERTCVTLQIGQRVVLDPLHPTIVGRDHARAAVVVHHPRVNRSNFAVRLLDGRWVFDHYGGTFPILFNGVETRAHGQALTHGDLIAPVEGLVFRFVDPP